MSSEALSIQSVLLLVRLVGRRIMAMGDGALSQILLMVQNTFEALALWNSRLETLWPKGQQ